MNKRLHFSFLIPFLLLLARQGQAQEVVYFSDANFKAALLENKAINKNGDGEIQVSEASSYKSLMNVSGKNISDLRGVETFTAITALYCNDNNLSAIDVSANTKLTVLRCDHNKLTSLDVSTNTALTDLRCYVNLITDLDLEANAQLRILWCFQNRLSELSTASNQHLTQLKCSFNLLSSVDVSTNHKLIDIDVRNNSLKWLNVKNGNNSNFTFFDASQNPKLLCIQVDDPAYSKATWTNRDQGANYSSNCESADTNIVYIPDVNFKNVLLASRANKNGDTEIQVLEAASYTEFIYAPAMGIKDVTGLEAFTSLSVLSIYDNPITSLDVSHNKGLRELKCNNTLITALNVQACTNLETLHCFNNPGLTSLDLSKNTKLATLWCFGSKLTSLDISASNKIRELQCSHNQLTSLTIGNQPNLFSVYCFANKLSTLDISQAPNLITLECNLNKLTALNVHANTELRSLLCHDNLIDSLDLSNNVFLLSLKCTKNRLRTLDLSVNPRLYSLECQTNELTFLNVKNGNNERIRIFNAIENPHLTCIHVDDVGYSEANWPLVDPHSSFSTNCDGESADIVTIPDRAFKARVVGDATINTNGDSEIQVTEARAVNGSLNLDALGITTLIGIQAFTSITHLNCEHNDLTELDISQNTALLTLECGYNRIGQLTLNNTLENLYAYNNRILGLNLSQLTSLKILDVNSNDVGGFNFRNSQIGTTLTHLNISDNPIMSIDLSYTTALQYLYASNTNLKVLNVSFCPDLVILYCPENRDLEFINAKNGNNTSIKTFNATINYRLECVQVDDVAYAQSHFLIDEGAHFNTNCSADADVVNIPDPNFRAAMVALVDGKADGNLDGKVQYREAEELRSANVSAMNIYDLTGLEAFRSLQFFNCSYNHISTITNPGQLFSLNCSNNQITQIINNAIISLTGLDASNNNLTELPDLNGIDALNVNNNSLTSLDMSSLSTLSVLYCSNNQLSYLNVKNGNNTYFDLKALNNPMLTCIEVDDPEYSEANWRDDVDPGASFSTNCSSSTSRLQSITAYPNPTSGHVTIDSSRPLDEVQVFDMITGELKSIQHGNKIDMSNLKNGIYRVQINQHGTVTSLRIMKE